MLSDWYIIFVGRDFQGYLRRDGARREVIAPLARAFRGLQWRSATAISPFFIRSLTHITHNISFSSSGNGRTIANCPSTRGFFYFLPFDSELSKHAVAIMNVIVRRRRWRRVHLIYWVCHYIYVSCTQLDYGRRKAISSKGTNIKTMLVRATFVRVKNVENRFFLCQAKK